MLKLEIKSKKFNILNRKKILESFFIFIDEEKIAEFFITLMIMKAVDLRSPKQENFFIENFEAFFLLVEY